MQLSDESVSDIVTSNLWNESTTQATCLHVGSKVTIEKVVTESWNDNSTKRTKIQVARFMYFLHYFSLNGIEYYNCLCGERFTT